MARLHVEVMGASAAAGYVLFTHGIYGSGANWRSIARAVLASSPGMGAVLVDLRGHGRSPDGDAPQTLLACARDVEETLDELAAQGMRVVAVCGHSFGGKVVMQLRALRQGIASYWVMDSTPSPRPDAARDSTNTVQTMLRALMAMPNAWPTRDAFIAALVERGQTKAIATWMAMNLVARDGGEFGLRLSLPQMEELLNDYYQQDTWNAILAPDRGAVHMVIAQDSVVVSPSDRERLQGAGASLSHLHTHYIANCGHWLHIDQPARVAQLLASHLSAP